MTSKVIICLTLVTLSASLTFAAPNTDDTISSILKNRNRGEDIDDDWAESNLLIPYKTLLERRDADEILSSKSSVDERKLGNSIPIGLDIDRTRNNHHVSPSSTGGESDLEKLKSISFNNREVKLIGPERKEVEVKSDVATQMLIALENLQKEATDVWGQVNVKLDKGWTDFKSKVESAVNDIKRSNSASTSRQLRETNLKDSSSLVMVSDIDGYSMADEGDVSKQMETAGAKIKGFFSNIGINEENGKKANEALSKAGASVSETVTKDIPDALKKAGTSISDTVTKDIPEAFKNFFG